MVRRLNYLRNELRDSAPVFLRSELVDVIVDGTAFSIIAFEECQARWFAGERIDAREYGILNQCATKMLADTAKRTTYTVAKS